ncbi:MAG: SRPBCC family protein [Alphaproteobacteria bacterium]
MDKVELNAPAFVYAIYIKAAPEAVWRALTRPEFTEKFWWGRRFEGEWRQGASLTLRAPDGEPDFTSEVLECEPPRRLVYTFDVTKSDEPASRVIYEIETVGDSVRLTVTHDHFLPDSKVRDGVANGWPGILSGLKTLLETGATLDLKVA